MHARSILITRPRVQGAGPRWWAETQRATHRLLAGLCTQAAMDSGVRSGRDEFSIADYLSNYFIPAHLFVGIFSLRPGPRKGTALFSCEEDSRELVLVPSEHCTDNPAIASAPCTVYDPRQEALPDLELSASCWYQKA